MPDAIRMRCAVLARWGYVCAPQALERATTAEANAAEAAAGAAALEQHLGSAKQEVCDCVCVCVYDTTSGWCLCCQHSAGTQHTHTLLMLRRALCVFHVLHVQLLVLSTHATQLEERLAERDAQLATAKDAATVVGSERDAAVRNLLRAEAELNDVSEFNTRLFRQARLRIRAACVVVVRLIVHIIIRPAVCKHVRCLRARAALRCTYCPVFPSSRAAQCLFYAGALPEPHPGQERGCFVARAGAGWFGARAAQVCGDQCSGLGAS